MKTNVCYTLQMEEACFSLPEDAWSLSPADHCRTIIHLDVDCFYAQVEMVRNPSLRDKPLGVKQKNLVVTCNYVARSMGVKKCVWVKEALEALPDLVLVDGSDLTHYRRFSSEISAVAQSFTPDVERLGLDENFVDITEIVGDYLGKSDLSTIEGHIYGDKEPDVAPTIDPCGCGCQERMIAGALVAKKLRQQIFESTGITCCAGVAHNKLLAKLVSGYYKPNQQTVLFPWLVHHLMNSLDSAKSIPGIGSSTFKALEELGISTLKDLQSSSQALLQTTFDEETSKKLKDLSFGIDETPVRRSGRPQSIGLEDAFRKVSCITDVRLKYSTLLDRLLKLLKEDGRIPASLRVCVRKFDSTKKFGHRESRQAPISSSLFASGVQSVGESTRTLLMEQIMGLFHKMVDTSKPYHLTLLAVGFNKLTERATEEKSISRFFLKRKRSEAEYQDISKIMNDDSKHAKLSSPESISGHVNAHSSQPSSGDACCSLSGGGAATDSKSPVKNVKIKVVFPDQTFTTETEALEISRVNSSEEVCHDIITDAAAKESCDVSSERKCVNISDDDKGGECSSSCDGSGVPKHDTCQSPPEENTHSHTDNTHRAPPPGIDQEVFNALPPEIQDEILNTHKGRPPDSKPKDTSTSPKTTCKRKSVNPTLERYFKKSSSTMPRESSKEAGKSEEVNKKTDDGNSRLYATTSGNSSSSDTMPHLERRGDSEKISEASVALSPASLQPPDGVDPNVFSSLPEEIQREIVEEQKHLTLSRSSLAPKDSPSCSRRGRGGSTSSIMRYIKKL